MEKEDTWETVEIPDIEENDVEYEIEEVEEQKAAPEVEPKAEEENKESPKELEGIETDGAQKRIRQLIRQRKERDEQLTLLQKQNEALNKKLQSKDTEVKEINKLTLDASEKQLTDKIELARAVYLEAFEEGEKEKLLNAQEMLNEAQTDLKAVNTAKLNYERESKQTVQDPVQNVEQPRIIPDPRAEEWAADNSWFGQDNIMTAAALAIDAELKNEGYDPNNNDFFKEIDNRIKETFPHKFGDVKEIVQEDQSKPAQVVSGGSRSSPSSKNKVKLSQEDLRLAQKWNIPLETYAAQKLKVTQADGEYTDIK